MNHPLKPDHPLFQIRHLTQVRSALGEHPSQRTRRNNQRIQEPALERGIAEDELANKVRQRNAVRPHAKVVRDRVRDVVSSSHTNDCREEGPGSEDAAGERSCGNRAIAVE